MSTVRTSAPGKLVYCGEYVVLDGAPAIGVAVNRRSVLSAQTVVGGQGSYRCPGFDERLHRYSTTAERHVEWQDGGQLKLVDAAIAAWPGLPAMDAVADTSAFRATTSGDKLGLGSSASLAVSLTAAFATLSGEAASLEAAHDVHRNFQDGRGSGIDVATCLAGGVIEFSVDRRSHPQRLAWPDGLCLALYWTGIPSSTSDRLRRFEKTGDSASRARLAQASRDVIGAWGDAADTLQATASYVEALSAFDTDLDLDIFGGGHDHLRTLAQKLPVVYKPCGAGGGDIGIALALEPGAIDEFTMAAASEDIARLDARIDVDGLLVEEWHP